MPAAAAAGRLAPPPRRQFGVVASFVFGEDAPPQAVRSDWEAGLELTQGGKIAEAEVAFHRALAGIDTAGYAPRSGQGRATVAAIWRDLARAQSMQGKAHEGLHNLRRALAVYDGIDQSADLLDVARHWNQQSGVSGKLAKEMPRVPDGVPVDLLLNILDNIVSHCIQLHGDTEPFLQVRLVVLTRAEAVREFHKMDVSTTLEEKAVALYKSKKMDEAIAELRRALADAPPLPIDPPIAPVLRRITAHRTLAAWLADRASSGGSLADSDQAEGTRLYERALELLDAVFPEDEEELMEENPDFKPQEQSLADALQMELTRVRFALLLQLMRLHAAGGKQGKERAEDHGRRLLDRDFLEKAEKMGAAAPTEEFTDARKAWRAALLRVAAEAFTRVGSDEAAQRWRDVIEICKGRERDVHMQMGMARPTAEMRGQTADALLGLAAALHPPWLPVPPGVMAQEEDGGGCDPAKLESTLEEIESSLREALEVIEQVGDAEMDPSSALATIMLARTLRVPFMVNADSSAGRGVSFLTKYPARAREFSKLVHSGLASATSALGDIPTLPTLSADSRGSHEHADGYDDDYDDEEEEDFGDQREWRQLSDEEQEAARRLGWFEETWDEGDWLDEYSSENCVRWDELTDSARADAMLLGYDKREWDLCYYADDDAEGESEVAGKGVTEQQQPKAPAATTQDSQVVAAGWDALHAAEAGAALKGLSAGHRRAVELSVDCALEQLLVIAAEIAEEAADLDAASQLQAAEGGGAEQLSLQHAEARVRWWGLLEPACAALVPATAQRHGGCSEALATTLSLLAKAKEETGQMAVALKLYERVGNRRWDGSAAENKRIQLSGKFEIGRLHAGSVADGGVQRAEQVFRAELDAMLAEHDGSAAAAAGDADDDGGGAVDPHLLAVFTSGLEAVLRSQGRGSEADELVARVAKSQSSR